MVSHQFADTSMIHTVCLTTITVLNRRYLYRFILPGSICLHPFALRELFLVLSDSTGMAYTFEGGSNSGQIESWVWDFGDGSYGTGQMDPMLLPTPILYTMSV